MNPFLPPEPDYVIRAKRGGPSPVALLLSALLNLMIIIALIYIGFLWSHEKPKADVEVDLVTEPPPPPPKAPPPPPPPEPPKPPPPPKPPEPKPPEPKPPEPKQEEQRKQEKEPEKAQRPQLTPAQLAQRSSAPHPVPESGEKLKTPAMLPSQNPTIKSMSRGQADDYGGGISGPMGIPLTQNEQDYIMSEILPLVGDDLHRVELRDLSILFNIMILPDGMLATPFNANDPYDAGSVIENYRNLPPVVRRALEEFYTALRVAQPLKLPPGEHWPRLMHFRYQFKDL